MGLHIPYAGNARSNVDVPPAIDVPGRSNYIITTFRSLHMRNLSLSIKDEAEDGCEPEFGFRCELTIGDHIMLPRRRPDRRGIW